MRCKVHRYVCEPLVTIQYIINWTETIWKAIGENKISPFYVIYVFKMAEKKNLQMKARIRIMDFFSHGYDTILLC